MSDPFNVPANQPTFGNFSSEPLTEDQQAREDSYGRRPDATSDAGRRNLANRLVRPVVDAKALTARNESAEGKV